MILVFLFSPGDTRVGLSILDNLFVGWSEISTVRFDDGVLRDGWIAAHGFDRELLNLVQHLGIGLARVLDEDLLGELSSTDIALIPSKVALMKRTTSGTGG